MDMEMWCKEIRLMQAQVDYFLTALISQADIEILPLSNMKTDD